MSQYWYNEVPLFCELELCNKKPTAGDFRVYRTTGSVSTPPMLPRNADYPGRDDPDSFEVRYQVQDCKRAWYPWVQQPGRVAY